MLYKLLKEKRKFNGNTVHEILREEYNQLDMEYEQVNRDTINKDLRLLRDLGVNNSYNDSKHQYELIPGLQDEFWYGFFETVYQSAWLNMDDDHPKNPKKYIEFHKGRKYEGNEVFRSLMNAIVEKKEVTFIYNKYNAPSENRVVDPYLMKEYEGDWYLIGWDNHRNANRTFALDRISSVDMRRPIETLRYSDPHELFKNVIGVHLPGDNDDKTIRNCRIWFEEKIAPYIENEPLHSSQQRVHDEMGGTVFEYELIWTQDLKNRLMKYGSQVEILVPDVWRQIMMDEFQRSLKSYN
ncbi:helix-turn-helix transcriptional regulator [Balneola sp. MJW-20]